MNMLPISHNVSEYPGMTYVKKYPRRSSGGAHRLYLIPNETQLAKERKDNFRKFVSRK